LATGVDEPIPVDTMIEIGIDYIINPISTMRTSPYKVSVYSKSMYLVSETNQYGDVVVM
jgi:hypothetical protein